MSSLMHHGVKGQRWGVRRFQNKDGTRTAAGKKQLKAQRLSRNEKGIRDVYRSLSDEDFRTLGYSKEEADQERKDDFLELGRRHTDYDQYNRVRYKDGKAVGYIAATGYQTTVGRGKKVVNILAVDLAVHSEYRGNGYSVALGKDLVRWFDTYGSKEYDRIEWYAMSENIGSQKAAERSGFTRRSSKEAAKGWVKYRYDKKQKLQHTSIGGTMYIEGNALILGDSSYLEHHGTLGQKWGVRRFQNKDGTRTAAGKARDAENLRSSQEARNVNTKIHSFINKQLSSEDLDAGKSNYDFASDLVKDPDFEKVIMPVVQDIRQTKAKYGNKEPYEFTGDEHQAYMNDISRIDNKTGELAIAIGLAEKGEPNKKSTPPEGEYERVDMFRYALARYLDEHSPDGYSDEGDWIYHSSMEGTFFIEDGTLYLSHHGIRGQRWGVRRFQNKNGSLTNAGRKRLGYATKGAAQTVGKAFKAGVKAGGNAVKAAKAHHEKKEAEKLQKKKEKASKTRLGVMANKDLFTNEEIRKLNERFKLEDEMKMATLQKGVEIAKAVGTIAQNVGTVAKTYEDVTGQSLSPIKRKAAEEKARQDKEDRERRIAREDADEARKAAKEERDIAIHEQTLRKAIASADTQEFTAQKTKAEADSSVLDAIKKGQDFNGGSGTDASGKSWMEKAKNGGKNPFDDMIADRDPEYAQIRKEHEEKVARKERIAELERREKEREAEKAAANRPQQPQQKQSNDDALFSQKGSLPIDKDRYKNSRAIEKAKQAKENAAEERAKKQDEKAAKATIDDMMEARRKFTDSARANSNGAFDRETAANYIKGKAKELPKKLNPINAISKKITDKALKEEEAASRKTLEDEYKKTSRSQGRDEANYTMYYNRVNALQAQGYSERQAKKVADTESPFSSKRNRRFEYNEKVGEIETTHRKNSKEINKANKELTDYYYKLVNGPGYEPGTPKREALDRKYAQKRGELERLEKDNNDMLDREKKKAKKILEHSLTIQNGVLFINAGEPYLEHHGVKGMKWDKHLMADKGVDAEAGGGGGGGGFAEDDEKLKEMAKKAGMSVAEYRNKFAKEISRMKTDSAERKEGSHWALAKADVYGKTENHMPLLENKHKDKNAKAAMINNARLAETKYKAQQAAQDYTRNHTNSQKDINKWRNAAYLDSSNHLHKELAEARTEKAQHYYKNSVGGKIDRAKLKAGSALREAKAALKEGPSGVGDRIYDVAGGKYKKQAASNTKAAREDVQKEQLANRMANQQRAREASEVRKKGGRASRDKGFNTVNGHDVIAEGYRNARQKHQKAASEANAKYEKSLAGRAEAAGKRVRKAGNELSAKAVAAKKRLKDVPGELYGSKHRKDFERNARLLEGSTRSAVEIGRDTYKRHGPTSGFGDPTYKATDDAYKRANKQWNKARISGQKYDRSIAKRVDSLVRKASKARKTTEQKKLFSGTSPKAKKAVIAKKKVTPTSYEKQISNARDDVEKAARANENAYKHANAIYTEGTRLVVNSKWG